MLGKDGLVVFQILIVLGPLGRDIGGQGHDPDLADGVVQHRAYQIEAQGDEAVLALGGDLGIDLAQKAGVVLLAPETHAVADLQPLARLHEGAPHIGRVAVVQGGLDRHGQKLALGSGAVAHARQPGRDHAGVVEHQGVARLQEIRQVADDPVLKICAFHDQQARRVARVGGAQGDARLGQVEVEIGCPHGAWNAHAAPLRSSEARRKVGLAKTAPAAMSDAAHGSLSA